MIPQFTPIVIESLIGDTPVFAGFYKEKVSCLCTGRTVEELLMYLREQLQVKRMFDLDVEGQTQIPPVPNILEPQMCNQEEYYEIYDRCIIEQDE